MTMDKKLVALIVLVMFAAGFMAGKTFGCEVSAAAVEMSSAG